MVFPRARLIVAACLFVGWLGFLLFLVIQNQRMIVLSRPQFLAASLYVIADVRGTEEKPASQVKIERVAWAKAAGDHNLTGQTIDVKNLADLGKAQGYAGPGPYILPLREVGGQGYEIVPVPPSLSDVRIYPKTPETEAQLDEIIRQRG
jgi:hypothetical protein